MKKWVLNHQRVLFYMVFQEQVIIMQIYKTELNKKEKEMNKL